MNDRIKEIERLRAEIAHLKAMLEESEKMITALRCDRNYYREELARKGGNN